MQKRKKIYDNFNKTYIKYKKRNRKNNINEEDNEKKKCRISSDGLIIGKKQNIIIPFHNTNLTPGVNYNFIIEESIDEKSKMSIDFTKLKTKENIILVDDNIISTNKLDISTNSIYEIINNFNKKFISK